MVQIALIQMYNYPIPLSKLDLSGIVLVCFMQNGQDSASESWYRVTPASRLPVAGEGTWAWAMVSAESAQRARAAPPGRPAMRPCLPSRWRLFYFSVNYETENIFL